MLEIIKQLVREGFEVKIVDVRLGGGILVGEKKEKTPIAEKDKKREFVERIQKASQKSKKRINWKTIKKIKEAKQDGCTSGETAFLWKS